MEILENSYDRACCEIEDILNRPKLDKQDVELWGKLIDIVKDVEMVYDYQDKMDGYSQMNGGSYMRGRSGRMMSYGRSSNRYGRDDGYSRTDNKEVVLNHLRDVMDMATDEKDRRAISKLMSQMEQQ